MKIWMLERRGRYAKGSLNKGTAVLTTLHTFCFQVLDLDEHQMNWVTNHLGHTLDVHKIHYRMTSDAIERTQIAKILLLQDTAQVDRFFNKRLEDIQLTGKCFLRTWNAFELKEKRFIIIHGAVI